MRRRRRSMDLRELRELLDARASAVPEPDIVDADVIARVARSRRRLRRTGIAVTAAAILAIVGVGIRLGVTGTHKTGKVEVTEPSSTTASTNPSPAATGVRIQKL